MDRITKSLVEDFLNQNDLISENQSIDFEKFCNYTLISNEYNNSFDIDDIMTGKNQGIDGIGIIVNGKLVTSPDEVDDIFDLNKFIEAKFIFIQAKTSNNFEGSDILNFIFTVKDFFSENPRLGKTSEVNNFLEITKKIFDKSPYMTKGKPLCKLFYVTTGSWVGDTSLTTIINTSVDELKKTNLFKDIYFEPTDANRIQSLYTKTKESVSTTFTFKDKVTLPDIKDVEEAYLGLLPFEEFLKIVSETSDILKNIFYDNVRDYLGDNLVNLDITKTLTDGQFEIFGLLNNGITIVAESLEPVGNKFTIRNYQIVNGCQTSHVLFHNKDIPDIQKINIPLKLIVTQNEEIKNKITIATNRQTEIKAEQLEAFSNFQKKLEQYYNATTGEGKLYYERRTNQYNSDSSVKKTRVITIPNQIKVFSAMFLDLPHLVSGYYGKLAKNLGEKIFKSDHKFSPYYSSGLASYILELSFRNGNIDKKYKKARYHILMLIRRVMNDEELPQFNSQKMDVYCEKINTILLDPEKIQDIFNDSIKIIDTSDIDISNQKILYQTSTTEKLLKTFISYNENKKK